MTAQDKRGADCSARPAEANTLSEFYDRLRDLNRDVDAIREGLNQTGGIRFTCPHCAKVFMLDLTFTGSSGWCLYCGKRIEVPGGE